MSIWLLKSETAGAAFADRLRAHGITRPVACLTVMDMVPIPRDPQRLFPLLRNVLDADRIVVNSLQVLPILADWVQYGELYVPPGSPTATPWCAVGASTAQALQKQFGIVKVHAPVSDSGSEALWALPIWEGVRTVGFLRGMGGRHWLAHQCEDAGMQVMDCVLYRRVAVNPPEHQWAAFLHAIREHKVGGVLVSSGEILAAWISLLANRLEPAVWQALPVWVPSARVAQQAESLGLRQITRLPAPSADALAAYLKMHP